MDAIAKAMKAMVEQAADDCEHADEAQLLAWAESDSLMAVFAQKELVYRDQQRFIAKCEEAAR